MAPAAGVASWHFLTAGTGSGNRAGCDLRELYTGVWPGSGAPIASTCGHGMIELEPEFLGNQRQGFELSSRCIPNNAKGRSLMSSQNQNPGQQNQNPGQKPGQQQGGGQKPGQQQQDPTRQGGQGQQSQKDR